MKKAELSFINYIMSLGRSINVINEKIKNSQQRDQLTEEEMALLEKIHEVFYLPGVVVFDKDNMDSSKLKVVKAL